LKPLHERVGRGDFLGYPRRFAAASLKRSDEFNPGSGWQVIRGDSPRLH